MVVSSFSSLNGNNFVIILIEIAKTLSIKNTVKITEKLMDKMLGDSTLHPIFELRIYNAKITKYFLGEQAF